MLKEFEPDFDGYLFCDECGEERPRRDVQTTKVTDTILSVVCVDCSNEEEVNLMTKWYERAIKLRKEFKELYDNSEMISVETGGVQTTLEGVRKTPGVMFYRRRATDKGEYPFEIFKEFGGEIFFALRTAQEFDEIMSSSEFGNLVKKEKGGTKC